MENSIQIANYVISLCNESGFSISNLKLQKILYYIQWRWLWIYWEKIIDCNFESRVNWPVCRGIHNKYNWNWFLDLTATEPIITPENQEYDSLINEVVTKYWPLEARDLVSLTHKEGPRIDARKWLTDMQSSNNIITDVSIKDYFSKEYAKIN